MGEDMEMVERVARAIHAEQLNYAANADEWPFEAYPRDALFWRQARAAIEAMREPTKAMQMAGFHANKFVNEHDGKPGCPGVGDGEPFPRAAFDYNVDKCLDPERVKAWMAKPRCLVARVTIPADKAWAAMIDAALAPTPQGRER